MPTILIKTFRFEAAHWLPNVPTDHKCHGMHGHSYQVEVAVQGEVDPIAGWIIDLGDVSTVVKPIVDGQLDHKVLNDVPGLGNPTCEIIALWLYREIKKVLPCLQSITVHETATSRAMYWE